MAAKLVLAMVVLAVVLSIAVVAAFWYFTKKEELDHEKEMKQLERDETLFEKSSIEKELERERE